MMEDKELTARLAEVTPEAQEESQQEQPTEQLAQEDQNTNEDAQGETNTPNQVQPQQAQKDSGHFKKLRESLERSEREKEQLYELLRQQMQPVGGQVPQKAQEPDLDPNDYVPRTYVDKRLRETQDQMAQYQQMLYEQVVTNKLQTQYSDFSQVLSTDNVTRLREEHPEIAASLASNPDIKTKAEAAYKIMRKLGYGSSDQYAPDKQKVQTNSQKPRPAVASPLSYAHDFEYRRMNEDDMAKERDAMERAIQGG